jgi:CDP-2,3-bis-(O-geranylgeranyl)-sn-glycerol synthase
MDDMQPFLLFQLLVLIVFANAIPVFAKKLFGMAAAWPLDGGARLSDGQPLLGASKTLRGFVLSVLLTPVGAMLIGLRWQVGLVVAVFAMAGDLFSSFLKRRIGLRPSDQAMGLDQIPESFLPLFAARWLLPVTLVDVFVGTALFFVGSVLVSRLLFKLNVRDKPY